MCPQARRLGSAPHRHTRMPACHVHAGAPPSSLFQCCSKRPHGCTTAFAGVACIGALLGRPLLRAERERSNFRESHVPMLKESLGSACSMPRCASWRRSSATSSCACAASPLACNVICTVKLVCLYYVYQLPDTSPKMQILASQDKSGATITHTWAARAFDVQMSKSA